MTKLYQISLLNITFQNNTQISTFLSLNKVVIIYILYSKYLKNKCSTIIKKRVYPNVIDKRDPKLIWDIQERLNSQVKTKYYIRPIKRNTQLPTQKQVKEIREISFTHSFISTVY